MASKKYQTNINCGGCVATVTPYLEKVEGLVDWKVNTQSAEKVLEVTLETNDDSELVAAVQSAGFTIKPIGSGLFSRFRK